MERKWPWITPEALLEARSCAQEVSLNRKYPEYLRGKHPSLTDVQVEAMVRCSHHSQMEELLNLSLILNEMRDTIIAAIKENTNS